MAIHHIATALALAGAVLVAPAGHANPVACEIPGSITITEDCTGIHVWYLDLCSNLIEIKQHQVIEWNNEGTWEELEKDPWEPAGQCATEGGSGIETYSVFARTVACPVEGSIEVRQAWTDGVNAWEFYKVTVPCALEPGDCSGLGDDDACDEDEGDDDETQDDDDTHHPPVDDDDVDDDSHESPPGCRLVGSGGPAALTLVGLLAAAAILRRRGA